MNAELVSGVAVLTGEAAAGIAFAVVGLLGWQGRLPRNRWAGIRVPATMTSPEAWARAHRAAGPAMAAGGGALVLGVMMLLSFRLAEMISWTATVWGGVALAGVAVAISGVSAALAVGAARRTVPSAHGKGDTR